MDDMFMLTRFVELAPLTRSFAVYLARHVLRSFPREVGRPRRGEQEQRLLDAMDNLVVQVQEKRSQIFDLVDAAVQQKQLTTKWFVQIVNEKTPGDTLVYPQRISEWKKGFLLLNWPDGQLDPQSVCCILITRMLNPGRTAWLPPHPLTIESFYVWRLDAPGVDPYPYELPIISSNAKEPIVVKRSPIVEGDSYLLYTHWRGAAWDDPEAWLLTDDGAIRWVGEINNERAIQWLLPHEQSDLADMQSDDKSLARRVLHHLANRLLRDHRSTSSFDK